MKKDDRNCMMPYPIYPPYQGVNMVPQMGMPNMGMPMYPSMSTSSSSSNNIEQQLNNIEQEINNLDRRISNLENAYNSNLSNNKYSSSNYQMM